MAPRLDLQALFVELTNGGNVYFQSPSDLQMEYPCIRYHFDDDKVDHADNLPYFRIKRYSVAVIDRNPDSLIPDKVAQLPLCSFDRFYVAENLNHFLFKLFF